MNIRRIVASALVLLFATSTLNAQAGQAYWQSYAERVGPRSLVVVYLAKGRRVEGHIVQVSEQTLTVLPKTRIPVPVRQLPIEDIQSIEIEREGWSPGAKVLVGVGSVFGLFAGIAIAMLAGSR